MKKYWNKKLAVILALVLVAVAPLLLREREELSISEADDVLVVITPHNETIRRELSEAFNSYWQEKTGRTVYIDWRTPGGAAEIRMVLDSKFLAKEKRAETTDGIGIDVLFGGGEYLLKQAADKGQLQQLDVFERQSEWFTGEKAIPASFTGENYYDSEQRWVGVCLAQFGICYNTDGIKRLGVKAPASWDDLGDPRYFGKLAMSDPAKSGSVARAFEMLVQQKIHRALAETRREPGETEKERQLRAIRYGWANGLNLVQRIAANARYFTDSATKIPHDVAQGDAVAGMCIDFYGRAYNEKLKKADGSSRLMWVVPAAGSSLSVDPVGVFKGAENRDVAQDFVEFLLSERGQLLWNKRVNTAGGPRYRALRRLPIRPDVYTELNLMDFSDPEALPYSRDHGFTYQSEITGPAFAALRLIIRSMCIDAHSELKQAWVALAKNQFPERAVAHFHDVSYVSYDRTMGEIRRQLTQGEKLDSAEMAKRITSIFRRNYKETVELAEEASR